MPQVGQPLHLPKFGLELETGPGVAVTQALADPIIRHKNLKRELSV
jgi:hypothetical protein